MPNLCLLGQHESSIFWTHGHANVKSESFRKTTSRPFGCIDRTKHRRTGRHKTDRTKQNEAKRTGRDKAERTTHNGQDETRQTGGHITNTIESSHCKSLQHNTTQGLKVEPPSKISALPVPLQSQVFFKGRFCKKWRQDVFKTPPRKKQKTKK